LQQIDSSAKLYNAEQQATNEEELSNIHQKE